VRRVRNHLPAALLQLTVSDGRVVEQQLAPPSQSRTVGRVVEGVAADRAIADWHALRPFAGLESAAGMG
jgi:hypothetical protein